MKLHSGTFYNLTAGIVFLQQPAKRKFEFNKEQSSPGPSPAKKMNPAGSPEAKAAIPKHKPSPASTPSPSTTKGKAYFGALFSCYWRAIASKGKVYYLFLVKMYLFY